ncbi:MAG: MarR family transcriptional regulator [Propionibacteriaceae bacterium]
MAKAKTKRSEIEEVRILVAAYVAAGADESVQRVVTAVHRLARRLNQWYDRQLADLDITTGEWAVLSELARLQDGDALTPSQLAASANVAPSSMTHRLDRMVERDMITRQQDPDNRTRVLVRMSDAGWQLYASAIRESNVVEADLIAGLSPEQTDVLASLLERVIAGLDEADL